MRYRTMATLLLNDKWDLFFLPKNRPGEGAQKWVPPGDFLFHGHCAPRCFSS